MQKQLLKGVLGSDIIGFHTNEYKRNFTEACTRSLYATYNVNEGSGSELTFSGE